MGRRGAKVRVPPPLFFVAPFLVALLAESSLRLEPFPASEQTLAAAGGFIVACGAALVVWAIVTFRRARTTIVPFLPVNTVVTHGPFKYSRNPMYVGMTVAYLGASVMVNSGWALVLLPPSLGMLYWWVIRREEDYLTREFGDQYVSYTTTTRRFL